MGVMWFSESCEGGFGTFSTGISLDSSKLRKVQERGLRVLNC